MLASSSDSTQYIHHRMDELHSKLESYLMSQMDRDADLHSKLESNLLSQVDGEADLQRIRSTKFNKTEGFGTVTDQIVDTNTLPDPGLARFTRHYTF